MINVILGTSLTDNSKYYKTTYLYALPRKGDYVSILGKDGKYRRLEVIRVIHLENSDLTELKLTVDEEFKTEEEAEVYMENLGFRKD